MPSACTQAKVICLPLSFLHSSVFPYLCSFFCFLSPFGGIFIFQSLHLGITNKPYSLFSPTSRLFIQHISEFCYFFLFLSLKAVTSFLFPKTKILILTSLSTTACPLLLKMYSVVKPHKLAKKVPVFHSRWLHSFTLSCLRITSDSTEVEFIWTDPGLPFQRVSPAHFASPHCFHCRTQFIYKCCHTCEVKMSQTLYLCINQHRVGHASVRNALWVSVAHSKTGQFSLNNNLRLTTVWITVAWCLHFRSKLTE